MERVSLLFVDDDADDRDIFSTCLLESNIQSFLILESGEAAFGYLTSLQDQQLPDLIVTDLNMPGVDGLELISLLKSDDRYQKIPIFILSTSSKNALIDSAIRFGAAGYYQKPNTVQELRSLMQEINQMAS